MEKDQKILFIGYYYERLARLILGMTDISSFNDWKYQRFDNGPFDFVLDGIHFQVKGWSNMDILKYFRNQLEAQIDFLTAESSDCHGVAMFFSYRNSSRTSGNRVIRGRPGRMLHLCQNLQEVRHFLLVNTTKLFVLDLSLLQTLADRFGFREYRRDPSNTRQTLAVTRRILMKIAENPRYELASVGLKRKQISLYLPNEGNPILDAINVGNLDEEIKVEVFYLLPEALRREVRKSVKREVCVGSGMDRVA